MRKTKINILACGGTIDKIYFDAKSDYQVGDPQVLRVLEESRVNFDYDVQSVLRKDSLEIDDQDRGKIRRAVEACDSSCVLITHGTDTMIETAKFLDGIPDKTIVLTGSLEPARLRDTDAVFNIGCAVAAVQALSPGVYVVMNGRIFDPYKSRKNVAKSLFEDIDNP